MKKKIESDYTLDELREMMINSHLENDEKKARFIHRELKKHGEEGLPIFLRYGLSIPLSIGIVAILMAIVSIILQIYRNC